MLQTEPKIRSKFVCISIRAYSHYQFFVLGETIPGREAPGKVPCIQRERVALRKITIRWTRNGLQLARSLCTALYIRARTRPRNVSVATQ